MCRGVENDKKATFENRRLFLPGRSQRRGLAQRSRKKSENRFNSTVTFMKKFQKKSVGVNNKYKDDFKKSSLKYTNLDIHEV